MFELIKKMIFKKAPQVEDSTKDFLELFVPVDPEDVAGVESIAAILHVSENTDVKFDAHNRWTELG